MTTTATKPTLEVAPFRNERVKDFSDPADAAAMMAALDAMKQYLGKHYPLVIDGRKIETEKKIRSLNPANPQEVVGITSSASKEQAVEAIEAAARAFESWRHRTLPERAAYLFKVAELLRARRFNYDALLVYEVGKSWAEADGDISESIDFVEFYAREALRYAQPQPVVPLEGERNELVYIPLGVGAVIPPWNFAGAIMIGMASAAIVCGNTIVLKPSSDAAVIAAWFVDLLHEVGVPPGVVNFIPGSGSEIGDAIVTHPEIRFVSFTGSKEVGLRINELAATPQPGQKWIKRVVAEMGGKDSIVIASDADIDAAVEGVAVSAFGFQGQKCSACSRAIVEEKVYDEFVDKLRRRVGAITVGDPRDPANFMGPVINEGALKSIMRYIERGASRGSSGDWRQACGRSRIFLRADRHRRRRTERNHRARGDLRTGARRDQSKRLRRRPGDRQQHRVRSDRLALHLRRKKDRACARRVLRRQSLLQPQEHRRNGRRPPFRRLQYVGHRQQSRGPRLPTAFHAGKIDLAKALVRLTAPSGSRSRACCRRHLQKNTRSRREYTPRRRGAARRPSPPPRAPFQLGRRPRLDLPRGTRGGCR